VTPEQWLDAYRCCAEHAREWLRRLHEYQEWDGLELDWACHRCVDGSADKLLSVFAEAGYCERTNLGTHHTRSAFLGLSGMREKEIAHELSQRATSFWYRPGPVRPGWLVA
jgi:hypothetical protein